MAAPQHQPGLPVSPLASSSVEGPIVLIKLLSSLPINVRSVPLEVLRKLIKSKQSVERVLTIVKVSSLTKFEKSSVGRGTRSGLNLGKNSLLPFLKNLIIEALGLQSVLALPPSALN